MLRECLKSLLSSKDKDYEILIGNDYPDEKVGPALTGVDDQRIRYLNHPVNFGEMRNMNSLMDASCGRYFTWLADDDMHSPDFLVTVRKALEKNGFPKCVATSFACGETYDPPVTSNVDCWEVLTGEQFILRYLPRNIRVIGCYAMMDIDYIRSLGGMIRPHDATSHYSDILLTIKFGLLDRLVFINSPLVFFRNHEASPSWGCSDCDEFLEAQKKFLAMSINILLQKYDASRMEKMRAMLLNWFVRDYMSVVRRSGKPDVTKIRSFRRFIEEEASLCGGDGRKTVEYVKSESWQMTKWSIARWFSLTKTF